MKKTDFDSSSIIAVSAILLLVVYICEAGNAKTDEPLKCYVCDPDTCKDFNEKDEPRECTIDDLDEDKIGPSKLSKFSYIPYSTVHGNVPDFACLKLEAYDIRGRYVVRRCQLKLPGNESCSNFYKKLNEDPDRTYMNASCYVCDKHHGCNSSSNIYIWAPLVLFSILIIVFIK